MPFPVFHTPHLSSRLFYDVFKNKDFKQTLIFMLKNEATVTLGRGLTRCPRIEQNGRNRQSAPDRPQPRVLIHVVCLHTQTDEKWRTHTVHVEIVCERLHGVRALMCAHVP